jgi:periplasmic copper chaperone A
MVEGGWVRATVPGQQATGAFMRITAKEATQLVGVSSPVAGVADVHEMKLEGDVMRMRPVARLDLPAGRTIELQPGGYHVMLQELKQPLAVGAHVPVTLLLRNAAGTESKLELKLPVRAASPGGHNH